MTTLHLVGIFHTVHNSDYSHCAFTGKALRFAKMMKPYGYTVLEYSNEGSQSEANEHIVILNKDEFNTLFGGRGDKDFHGDDATIGSPGHTKFQDKLIAEMRKRVKPRDIICHPFGHAHEPLLAEFPECIHVETGIGYPTLMTGSKRIFESYAWMHYHQGKEGRNGTNYEWVVPNYFDLKEWEYCEEPDNYFAFMGRICSIKGLDTILEIARRRDIKIKIAGQGDPTPWSHPNIEYVGPLKGKERSDFIRKARASFMPTVFTEPFGGSGVEGMLCGTPLIAVDYGAFTETLIHGTTGYRCHTLQDWLDAVDNIDLIDRWTTSQVARARYSLEACGERYDKIFQDLSNLYKKGWYQLRDEEEKEQPEDPYECALAELADEDSTVVVVGAMDGVRHDALAKHLLKNEKWGGVLIEPVKDYFDRLVSNYRHRSNFQFANVAIMPEAGPAEIHRVSKEAIESGQVPSWCDGISTFFPGQGAITLGNIKENVQTETVECVRFKDIVSTYGLSQIDILQIDTEGADAEVFRQIWNIGFRPKVINLEVVWMEDFDLEMIQATLEGAGYNISRSGDNLIAVKKSQTQRPPEDRWRAPRLAFFTYPEWAFGSIHEALCKELYKRDIQATLLDWNQTYTQDEMQRLSQVYDAFVTHPGSGVTKLRELGVPYEQIIAIAHEVSDLEAGITLRNDFERFKQFAVISPSLAQRSAEMVGRKPLIVRNGIHFDWYYAPPSDSLKTLGYAGSSVSYMSDGVTDRKRGYLAFDLAQKAGLKFTRAEGYNYRTMPLFYNSVDAVVMTSTQEACGLPMMEAAAAGRLTLGTPVGVMEQFPASAGVLLPTEPDELLENGAKVLSYYCASPTKYKARCLEIQDFARETYDWSKVIDGWIEVLT